MINFAYTILYVTDVERSVQFYETAFGFRRKFISPDNGYGELICGDTTLSFASVALAQSNLSSGFIQSDVNAKPFGIEIGFTTDDVEATYQKAIAAGAVAAEPAKTKPWGQVVAYVKDPDGFLIEICTAMGE
jgi:catechol 2,3-dioxygenase-like lactoylglutathione lyase family enzyme